MFLGLREMRRAPGRFALVGAVIALMMFLVTFLTGLAAGLAGQNVSALDRTGADTVVAAARDGGFDWSRAVVDRRQAEEWIAAAGEDARVTPLAIAPARLVRPDAGEDAAGEAVTFFATPRSAAGDGIILAPDTARELGVGVGDEVDAAGLRLTVRGIRDLGRHSHAPVAGIDLAVLHRAREARDSAGGYATVLLVKGEVRDAGELARRTGTETVPLTRSFAGLASLRSEIGTLGFMIAMLFGISALVTGVFFLVWSMQRSGELAVLKALGAGDRWLVADAVGQALTILLVAIVAGSSLAVALGAAIRGVAPFTLVWWTVLPPAAAMLLAGVAGSLVSLRQIVRADPLAALRAAA